MNWELLTKSDQERSYLLVFEEGDEVIAKATAFAREAGLTAAHLTAIGAFSQVVLAYFDWDTKKYREIPVDGQVEALAVSGDIAMKEREPVIHAHAIVGLSDGTTRGGHLMKAIVRPTLEMILTSSPRYVRRVHSERLGVALIDLEALPGHEPRARKIN